jgi:hypothetical protein
MLGQNGFGHYRPETSGLGKANDRCDEMDDDNQQIAHDSSYFSPNTRFFAEIRIRQGQVYPPFREIELALAYRYNDDSPLLRLFLSVAKKVFAKTANVKSL